ncbi:UNVERIFIED_CONTAM: hypothetical protein Sindi_2875900, partial [Sesamum indicum]
MGLDQRLGLDQPLYGRLRTKAAHGDGGKSSDYGCFSEPWWTTGLEMGGISSCGRIHRNHLGPLCDSFPRGPRLLGLHESSRLSTVIHEGVWQWPLITDLECLEITNVLPTIFGGDD